MLARTTAAAAALAILTLPALAEPGPHPATLAGHAVMPALSFVDPPEDAPADLRVSGKFTTGRRVEAPGTVEGTSGDRPTGVKLPFRPESGLSQLTMRPLPWGSRAALHAAAIPTAAEVGVLAEPTPQVPAPAIFRP